MPFISNDPSWIVQISEAQIYSYYYTAGSALVFYDYVLCIRQELDLIWGKSWSFMTFLYAIIRYLGVIYSVANLLFNSTTIYMSDDECAVMELLVNWCSLVASAVLGAIMIARLYAMYERSKIMLAALTIIFVTMSITAEVMAGVDNMLTHLSISKESILFNTYECTFTDAGSNLMKDTWILGMTWEFLVFLVTMWICVKHFVEMRRVTPDWGIEDCFSVLMKNHALYFFAFFPMGSMVLIGNLYPGATSIVHQGFLQAFVQFILGPRLVISIRQYHVDLVSESDMATQVSTIAFGERRHTSIDNTA